MNNPKSEPRRRKKGFIARLQAKFHKLPAHLSNEEDWRDDNRHVKLSRAFGIVLGIHVIAVAGILVFGFFQKKKAPSVTSSDTAPTRSALKPAASQKPPATTTNSAQFNPETNPALQGLETYRVMPSDTLAQIASKFNVDDRQLAELNLSPERPLRTGMTLYIPKERNYQSHGDALALINNSDKNQAPRSLNSTEKTPAEDNSMVDLMPFSSEEEKNSVTKTLPPNTTPAAEPKVAPRALSVDDEEEEATPNNRPATKNKAASPPARLAIKNTPPEKKTVAKAQIKKPVRDAKREPEIRRAELVSMTKKPTSSARGHVVSAGENAYRIAKRYGVNVNDLLKANGGLNPSTLKPGQKLNIPRSR